MKRTFVEVQAFRTGWEGCGLSDADLFVFQNQLLRDPAAGDVVPGTGGIRKIRCGIDARGKRGGARILYIDFPAYHTTFLLYAYGKNERDDITAAEKKKLSEMTRQIENALRARGKAQ